jgi:serine-type D-Ala-D-Ala carboxypeptidase/endopeptidase (penicillin-binding protein 4)
VLGLVPGAALHAQTDASWLADRMSTWYRTTTRHAPGDWGIAIADGSGRLLWSVRPDEPMVPASTVKLFTTGFARTMLGGDARRSTRVMGEGQLDPATGEWIGTWSLELNGDPSLERAEGSGPTFYDLAVQLANAGVRKLNGPLQVISSEGPADAIYPAAWSTRHRGRLFAPLVGPLTLHENVVWLTVRPGEKVGRRVRVIETAPEGIAPGRAGGADSRCGSARTGAGW